VAAKRIMVVDDDPQVSALLKYRLEKEDYCILLSADGVDALIMAKAELPDLIILDLSLPRLNGFGFLEILRSQAEIRSIPVIILSAYGNEANRRRGCELGVVDFITKPFSPRRLAADVRRALGTSASDHSALAPGSDENSCQRDEVP
jgi:DNA-binding response OmpR family regulator